MTYARARIAWFSIEMLAVWAVLSVLAAAAAVLIQPRSWSTPGGSADNDTAREWRLDFARSGYDLRSLPPLHGLITTPDGQRDLATAIADADIIVAGSVLSLDFSEAYVTRVTFAVDSAAKGSASPRSLLIYETAGGPVPLPENSRYVSGYGAFYSEPWMPYLVPGDRAVLFLQERPGAPPIPQAWTGVYRASFGQIEPSEGVTFSDEVAGLKVEALLERVRLVLRLEEQGRF